MTTEIEKKFFKAFGIDYYDRYFECSEQLELECKKQCECCDFTEEVYCYPEITDRILLELICILTKVHPEMDCCCFLSTCENIEQLKELALEDCLEYSEHIYIAVRKLFGVEEQSDEK